MRVRLWVVFLAAVLAAPALAADDPDNGPIYSITAEQADVLVDAPQFAGAKVTFHRQTIGREVGLRDLAIYRGQGEIAAVMYDTLDGDIVGRRMERSDGPVEVIESLEWFLPKGHRAMYLEKAEYPAKLISFPYQRVRLFWQGGAGDCISFIRTYDPKPGRSTASKRLAGVYCRTVLSLDEAAITSFLDGIKTKQK